MDVKSLHPQFTVVTSPLTLLETTSLASATVRDMVYIKLDTDTTPKVATLMLTISTLITMVTVMATGTDPAMKVTTTETDLAMVDMGTATATTREIMATATVTDTDMVDMEMAMTASTTMAMSMVTSSLILIPTRKMATVTLVTIATEITMVSDMDLDRDLSKSLVLTPPTRKVSKAIANTRKHTFQPPPTVDMATAMAATIEDCEQLWHARLSY